MLDTWKKNLCLFSNNKTKLAYTEYVFLLSCVGDCMFRTCRKKHTYIHIILHIFFIIEI